MDKRTMKPKAKKGQILIFVLVIMVLGLITITPLLYYLSATQKHYQYVLIDTNGYYSANSMMDRVLADMSASANITAIKESGAYNSSSWLNGCKINTSISNVNTSVLPQPVGEEFYSDVYIDPGVDTNLSDLANGANYSYPIFLTVGTNLSVNWVLGRGEYCGNGYCNPVSYYYSKGTMWLKYINGTIATTIIADANDATAHLALTNWSVPQTGNYSLTFKSECRSADQSDWGLFCVDEGSSHRNDSAQTAHTKGFSSIGSTGQTWIRVSTNFNAGVDSTPVHYTDFAIITTAKDTNNRDIVSIKAYVRQTPGAVQWWKAQTTEVVSWEITYY